MDNYKNINDIYTLKKIINDLIKENEYINNKLNKLNNKNK